MIVAIIAPIMILADWMRGFWGGLGWTTQDVAEQSHVSPCTVRHWRTAPAFREAIAKAGAEIRQAMIKRTVEEFVGVAHVRRFC